MQFVLFVLSGFMYGLFMALSVLNIETVFIEAISYIANCELSRQAKKIRRCSSSPYYFQVLNVS